jgi:hypothetical protein
MGEVNVKTISEVLKEHDVIWQYDRANNEYVFMCLSDKPIPLEVKNRVKLVMAFNQPDVGFRFIEAEEAVG